MSEPVYYDITIDTDIDASELVSGLEDNSLLGSWDQDETVHLYWPIDAWGEEKLKNLKRVLERLGEEPGASRIGISKLPSENWNARWAALVKPVRIGRRVVIRPSWEPLPTFPEAIVITLDPRQAFGTGHHATTQLLIEWLEECVNGNERVLDVGTGSGILAMVALRLGAKFALGIDRDPVAIACAKEYARENNFDESLKLEVQNLGQLQAESFDLIVANLDRRTLLQEAFPLKWTSSENARLLLSGILVEDQKEIADGLAKTGWELFGLRERHGWVALGFQPHSMS